MTEHILYENAPARVEIQYKYVEPPDDMSEEEIKEAGPELEPINREIIEIKQARAPAIRCECGENFEDWGPAQRHLHEAYLNDIK